MEIINNEIVEMSVEKRKVYIVEEHHHALLHWANVKRENRCEELLLFSLDHHTDILDPFLRYCQCNKEKMQQLVACIDYEDDTSINNTIANLKNDEHIKAAIQSGVLYKAFIISHSNTFDIPESIEEEARMKKVNSKGNEYIEVLFSDNYGITPRNKRHYREADIYIPPFLPEDVNEDDGKYDDLVLEDYFLEEKMDTLNRMCPTVFNKDRQIKYKYILDIDLDYFHTMKSVNPESVNVFLELVKGAEIITIAKESACVELVRTDEEVTSEALLSRLLALIGEILNDSK